MTSSLIEIDRDREPGIAVVRMRREARRNALDAGLIAALHETADMLRDDTSVRSVVLTGDDRVFSAGADLSTFAAIEGERDVNRVRRSVARGGRMAEAWQTLPQITIAAVEGGAVGGGLGLALACDWRVFARTGFAYVPEARLGLNYGWNTLPRLSALCGPARAKWISVLCRRHYGEELLGWGIADQLTETGGALEAAIALGREAASMPALAVQLIKRSVNAHSQAFAAASSVGDMEDMLVCMTDPEGTRARAAMIAPGGRREGRP
jgi:enoyl-CoA hydratase